MCMCGCEGGGSEGDVCVRIVRIVRFNFFFTSQRLPALPEKVFTRLDKLTRQNRVQEWVSGCGRGVGMMWVWGVCGVCVGWVWHRSRG